ncbi:hypothetical protein SK128_009910 [Halocaridina rubra]|uniref:EGF-like domain-containing protein n=1 Tax=Halocaridina rubra TaxID=373956 RepID=A0AAN9A1Z7_HALRR
MINLYLNYPRLIYCFDYQTVPNNTQLISNLYYLTETNCDPGFYFCNDTFLEPPCLPLADICDGTAQCLSHSADESVCGGCPDDYCQNGGSCSSSKESRVPPTCSCPSNCIGNRCEIKEKKLSAGAITGIVLGVIAFVILLVMGVFYFRNRKKFTPSRDQSSWDNPDNKPYYGPDLPGSDNYPLDDLSGATSSTAPTGIKNPSFKEDDPISDL